MGFVGWGLRVCMVVVIAAGPGGASAGESEPAAPPVQPRPADPLLNLHLDLYGFAYHPDRAGVRRRHLDNEVNAGLGLRYEFINDAQGVAFVEAGFYRDSGRNVAKLAGPGYQFKFGDQWRAGFALPVIQSPTYNRGRVFIAPVPLLTYDFGPVTLNAVYAPRTVQNRFAVAGFYFSIPFAN